MKKIIAILTAIAIVICMIPSATSETDIVTGTFTPIPTGVSIACNNSAPAFGNINLGENYEVANFNLTNEGDVNCSVVQTAGWLGTNTWTLVAGTSSPATSNEYCVNMDPQDGGYVDIQTQKTVIADLPPGDGTSIPWNNATYFDLKVFVSDFTTEGTPAEQTLYANLTAAALS